jgi:uncharacterized protein
MRKLKTYKNSKDYLEESTATLEINELENNLILGICNSLIDETENKNDYHFINLFQDDKIVATSIKTNTKVIVFETTDNKFDIKEIANYYLDNNISIDGVIGMSQTAENFAKLYKKEIFRAKPLLVQELRKTNEIAISKGCFETCSIIDIELLIKWTSNFFEEEELIPKKSKNEVEAIVKILLESRDFFCWKVDNKIVSIASILRKTKNIGIVGLVFTAKKFRGNGYASSCIKKLSDYILENGFQCCGLFTDKANPTSNKIYRLIGYETIAEFKNIEFV